MAAQHKEMYKQAAQDINDASWEWKESYSLQNEKSELIQSDLAGIGDLIKEEQHDWLWMLDKEERAADIIIQIKNIRKAQSRFYDMLKNWNVSNAEISEAKPMMQAETRILTLKEQLKDLASECDRESKAQRDHETYENKQEHSILWTLRIAIQRARTGQVDRGYWRWAKKLVNYANNASVLEQGAISKAATIKIKLGAYTLQKFVAAKNNFKDTEWIQEALDKETNALTEYNEEWNDTELPDSIAYDVQKYGLTQSEMDWAIDSKRTRAYRPYVQSWTDEAFFAEVETQEEYEEQWANTLLGEML